MRFGIREICDVVLRAKSTQKLGSRTFYKNEPVLYFDTLKTSSLEGAATTVYAQGGRGNSRLIAWEGERTLTFTMEDALLSMESFSILSGAGLIAAGKDQPIYIHQTSQVEVGGDARMDNTIILPAIACWNSDSNSPHFKDAADIFVMVLSENGEVNAEPCLPAGIAYDETAQTTTLTCYSHAGNLKAGSIVLVDYYVERKGGASMIEITPDKFGGFYYLEASTLFRREADGVDMPAEFIIPKCKVQSNFTFSMAATGDPSTFTFTLDAFPDYTKFDKTHKVLAAIQIIEDIGTNEATGSREPCEPDGVNANINTASVSARGANIQSYICGTDNDNIVVTGSSDGTEYDTATFGTTAVGTEVTINLPIYKTGGRYTVIQNNPGLSEYSSSDPSITGNVQTKEYDIPAGEIFDYSLLVTDKGGPITVELQNEAGQTMAKYTIATAVAFN